MEYVNHGLGSHITDRQWHIFSRNLDADLEDAQSGVEILEVNGFLIRGSGRVDDIKLTSFYIQSLKNHRIFYYDQVSI